MVQPLLPVEPVPGPSRSGATPPSEQRMQGNSDAGTVKDQPPVDSSPEKIPDWLTWDAQPCVPTEEPRQGSSRNRKRRHSAATDEEFGQPVFRVSHASPGKVNKISRTNAFIAEWERDCIPPGQEPPLNDSQALEEIPAQGLKDEKPAPGLNMGANDPCMSPGLRMVNGQPCKSPVMEGPVPSISSAGSFPTLLGGHSSYRLDHIGHPTSSSISIFKVPRAPKNPHLKPPCTHTSDTAPASIVPLAPLTPRLKQATTSSNDTMPAAIVSVTPVTPHHKQTTTCPNDTMPASVVSVAPVMSHLKQPTTCSTDTLPASIISVAPLKPTNKPPVTHTNDALGVFKVPQGLPLRFLKLSSNAKANGKLQVSEAPHGPLPQYLKPPTTRSSDTHGTFKVPSGPLGQGPKPPTTRSNDAPEAFKVPSIPPGQGPKPLTTRSNDAPEAFKVPGVPPGLCPKPPTNHLNDTPATFKVPQGKPRRALHGHLVRCRCRIRSQRQYRKAKATSDRETIRRELRFAQRMLHWNRQKEGSLELLATRVLEKMPDTWFNKEPALMISLGRLLESGNGRGVGQRDLVILREKMAALAKLLVVKKKR